MKLNLLQRELVVWIVFFLVCSMAALVYIHNRPNDHQGIIRLHVVANSNSEADQRVKLKVRNEIIKYMEGQKSVDEARSYIQKHIPDIEKRADKELKKNGFDYGAKAKLGVTFIPQKSYEDLTLPAGNYEALRVELGEGEGENWWCVIFPQLCLVKADDGIADEGTDNDVITEKIVLKSKIKEILKGL